jgi:hypothetical protein
MATAIKKLSFLKRGASPKNKAKRSPISSTACPTIIFGPTQGPLRALSPIVMVIKGPGIIAPLKAITNDVVKMVRYASMPKDKVQSQKFKV